MSCQCARWIAEPCNLKEWSAPIGRLFTCSRPGRATYGKKKRPIPSDTILLWINGLPAAPTLHLVSLLGWKKDGYSEFSVLPVPVGRRGERQTDHVAVDGCACGPQHHRPRIPHRGSVAHCGRAAGSRNGGSEVFSRCWCRCGCHGFRWIAADRRCLRCARLLVYAKAYPAMPVRDRACAAVGAVSRSQSNKP